MADLLERSRRAKGRKRRASEGRFAKLNTFTDVTLHTLKPAQGVVWFYLWRNEQPDGWVRESIRQIAAGTGLHRNGAHNAVKSLGRMGLVEVIKLAKWHGEHSVYRLHPTRTDESTVTHSGTAPSQFDTPTRHTQCDIPITP